MTPRVWVLDFPAPDKWINSNHRIHWATKAARTRTWRHTTTVHAKAARIPQVDRVTVLIEPCWADNRPRDAPNVAPTAKACLDGLTDAGVWADDNDRHVIAVTFTQGPKVVGPTRLRITITEVTQ